MNSFLSIFHFDQETRIYFFSLLFSIVFCSIEFLFVFHFDLSENAHEREEEMRQREIRI
jgi:hypothetical protein